MIHEILVTCEHGGNHVPRAYRDLFEGCRKLLEGHRGYDVGALQLARALGRRLDAPVVASTTTRLLVELNRSLHHRNLFSDLTAPLDAATKEEILARHYHPYRSRIESTLQEVVDRGRRVLHLSAHSFTPVWKGQRRSTDVGLLYDPSRSLERDLCRRWKEALVRRRPDLRVRFNYPYRGVADGLTTFFRRRFPPHNYLGVELEVSQHWVLPSPSDWKRVRSALIAALVEARRDVSMSEPW